MDLGLSDKCAVVLGATRGLGFGVGRQLISEGAKVVFVGRDPQKLSEISRVYEKAKGIAVDITSRSAPEEILCQAGGYLGKIDILVNNTGGPPTSTALNADTDQWRKQFEAMVLPLMRMTDLVVPGMKERGWGRILTIASSGVKQPIAGLALSNGLRSTLVGWSKTLSQELAPDGITVNMLLPGRIDTDRVRSLDQQVAERTERDLGEVQSAAAGRIPVGRYGTVDEFAAPAAFLASERASYITGQCLLIDGGLVTSI